MKNLTEGLMQGDLKDLILPLISIDEYESKIDENACVFAFYINDFSAAEDLDRFIQRTHIPILDTEISSAPDQHGYYMVFVELLINDKLFKDVMDIIEEVSDVGSIDKWSLHGRKTKKSISLTDENLKKLIPASNKTMEEQCIFFLKDSLLETIAYEDGQLKLTSMSGNFDFQLIEFTNKNRIMNKDYSIIAENLTFESYSQCHRLETALGEKWQVQSLGAYFVAKKIDSGMCLVLN